MLVGLSVGLVCVYARLLLVSPVHTTKLFSVTMVKVVQSPQCLNS